jgi:N-ethylmaleimide reductase
MDNLLFSPTTLAGRPLANRVVMAPMNRNRASGARLVPPAMTATYYAQRASAGLIIAEGTPVSPQARGSANTPGIYDPAQIAGWRKVTTAVHRQGGHIYLQLWHVGRVGHCSLRADASPPVGASAIGLQHDRVPILDGGRAPVLALCDPPRALETTEVRAIVGDFVSAAENAMAAGFDGVEIHAANGYLFDQFRCPYLNNRADAYGGTTTKRWRFLLETVESVAEAVGESRVGVRISPLGSAHEMQPDPSPLFTYGYLACQLDRLGIAYLHVFDQSGKWIHDPQSDLLQHLRACYSGTMILCGGFDRARAAAALGADCGDLIAFGRHFIANPDLVKRLRTGAPLAPWQSKTVYKGGAEGYIDYPTLEEEALSER